MSIRSLNPSAYSSRPASGVGRASAIGLTIVFLSIAPNLRAQGSGGTNPFVLSDAPVIALTNAMVIDGTGAPAVEQQTVLVRDGRIEAVGPTASVEIPEGAEVMDLAGKTVAPGMIMLHEHMFYPSGRGTVYNTQSYSFPRLYLGGGVTTMRTAGSMAPYADLNVKRAIDSGRIPGPRMHITAPYLNGPGLPIYQVKALDGPDDARQMVRYWADEGATSFKVYMHISSEELSAVVEEAHARDLKVTGHLCSITYREAADLGIDNLEHGLLASTDFVENKESDLCPGVARRSLMDVDIEGPEMTSLIRHLVENEVAITSTLAVFETFTPGRPTAVQGALDAMLPETREQYLVQRGRVDQNPDSDYATLFPKAMAFELAFARAGGLLVAGTDPTGYGGVVAGYANQRMLQLLVETGFTAEEAVEVSTLNGARYLEIDDEFGSIAVGKVADLMIIDGDPTTDPDVFGSVSVVLKGGVAYDARVLLNSIRGTVGLH